MAFNYANLGNQALENVLPIFGSMTNGAHHPMAGAHPDFVNQLAAAITADPFQFASLNKSAEMRAKTATTSAATASVGATSLLTKREHTVPETTTASRLIYNPAQRTKMKPNQGAAPMDLDNDFDIETPATTTTTSSGSGTTAISSTSSGSKSTEKTASGCAVHDSNIYLNGLINPTSGYMLAANSMLMDPSAMMAAAMQQMQQNYASYATITEGGTSTADGTSTGTSSESFNGPSMKEVIKTKSCILFPPNPNAPPPTIRERPPGCRTVFVGGLPENITEDIIREIFESCGEITTLRMSKKNFCHIRYRHETSIDRAIYLSGYRVRISNTNEPANFGRLHVDYAQARDDQYDYECKQRQLQREQRHRERMSLDRLRSQSPPPMPHYTDHEASLVAENLRNNETFVKAVQTITIWLERGDCNKRNANIFYSMIQITHGHVRHLHADKQQLEDDLRKARENYRKQMSTMSTQFTQIEKVFNAASHKKVWDHFTKAQRKNIDQWKKLASELRSIQIEDDEMEMSDDDRDYQTINPKRTRYDSENLKDENDSLRCQLEAIRNEMSLERTDLKYNSDFREKQIKVLQETIRNMQTQLMQTKMQEQKDAKTIEQLQRKLKEAGVKQLLLQTKIKETSTRLKDKENSSVNSETSEAQPDDHNDDSDSGRTRKSLDNEKDRKVVIDCEKIDDDVRIIEDTAASSPKSAEVETDASSMVELGKDEESPKGEDAQSSEELPVKDEKLAIGDDEILATATRFEETATQTPEALEDKLIPLEEAQIIAIASTFLAVQPNGAPTDTIAAHLCSTMKHCTLTVEKLEGILAKYLNLFKANRVVDTLKDDYEGGEESVEIRQVVKWKFCGFTAME